MKYDVLVFSDEAKTRITIIPEKLSSSDTLLVFQVKDAVDKAVLEALCKDAEATKIITYGQYDDETLQVTELKKYSQYTILSYLGTKYGQLMGYDYSTEDENTESGFAEIRADITEVNLNKKSYIQRQLDALKDSTTETASNVSEIENALLGEEETE